MITLVLADNHGIVREGIAAFCASRPDLQVIGQASDGADAVTQILDANRGNWGQGAFYTGGYEVTFDPVKQGGKNFLQVAKVTFEVDMSA